MNEMKKPQKVAVMEWYERDHLAARCAEEGCPDYQWNIKNVPQSKYCWKHAEAHKEQPTKRSAEVTHG